MVEIFRLVDVLHMYHYVSDQTIIEDTHSYLDHEIVKGTVKLSVVSTGYLYEKSPDDSFITLSFVENHYSFLIKWKKNKMKSPNGEGDWHVT